MLDEGPEPKLSVVEVNDISFNPQDGEQMFRRYDRHSAVIGWSSKVRHFLWPLKLQATIVTDSSTIPVVCHLGVFMQSYCMNGGGQKKTEAGFEIRSPAMSEMLDPFRKEKNTPVAFAFGILVKDFEENTITIPKKVLITAGPVGILTVAGALTL